jgi:alkanesulfonate monooxygenase SsuD/methylene tetrahydromethanopterin reductase-like flavin-dependent oxidoreductase (luciferase family)
MDIRIGIFVVPDGTQPDATIAQLVEADQTGLDFVAVQDHPYQRRFLDTWSLLAYVAGRTERVRLLTDVANLPLRPPKMLAKAAATLDVLSGGRFELGLGAGAFWEGVEAMDGPALTPKESVDALEAAIPVLRDFWAAESKWGGPPPAHPIGIWLGAYKPRMLRLTGRLADGWLPSIGGKYLALEDTPPMQATVDEAARAAGRVPEDVERAVNVSGLGDDLAAWPEQLARIAEARFTTLLISVPSDDPTGAVRRIGEEVAPRVRELLGG